MRVLGLESSCDETAAAIVDDGTIVRSDVVASQHEVHARYGGVVPELASRAHVVNVVPVVQAALDRAGCTLAEVDGIAVTNAPGLVGALLVGLQTAKAIAWVTKKPLVGVHHLEGHLAAIYLEPEPPPMPHLALVVSGGHTSLVRVNGHAEVLELGATRDDAAGEAFDKGAKLLGLGYPGGAVVDRLAKTGDPKAVAFPRAMTAGSTGADFSFSGLKTALLHHVRANGIPDGQALSDLCASYQAAIVEVLVRKTRRTARSEGLAHVQICGGVAANQGLRTALAAAGVEDGFRVYVPPPARCTDNAAMIAAAGYHHLIRGERAGLDLDAIPECAAAEARVTEPFPDARVLLDRYGLRAKKSFSQNFLISDRAFRAIVDATVRADDDWIVEIGAGLGTLTARLAERVPEGKVIALERDRDMIAVLRTELAGVDNVEIEEADALRYDLKMAAKWRGDSIAVCGNLPYQIAAPLMFRVLEARASVTHAVMMIQKEMADRIVAPPGGKDYGALGVMIRTYADVTTVAKVGAGSFVPAPKVDSTVIRLVPLAQPRAPIGNEQHYSAVVHAAFGQRRKTLRNALRAVFDEAAVDAALAATAIDGIRRGETLDIAEMAALANAIPMR